MSQLLLLGGKPVRRKWSIWEKKEPDYSYKSSHCALTTINVSYRQLFIRSLSYTIKSHLQPAISLSPSIPAKIPAAMRPENPVARICAQYKSAIRVAISGSVSADLYVDNGLIVSTFSSVEYG
jgi:hypothetical protein